nr:TolC family protein [Gemmatimonadaceae bacterium]
MAQNQFTEIARRAGPIAAPPADAPADPFALVFASPNARTGAVTASIRPFDGGVSLARHGAARSVAAAADDGVTLARAALELAIVTHYADAQLGRRLADVADSALAQAERTLAVTRAAFEAGRVPEYDVVRAEAAVEQQRPAAIEARRGARLAELALRQAITVPDDVALDLVTPLEDGGDAAPDTVIARVAVPRDSAPRRIALRQLAHRVDAADGESRAAWRELLPTIDVQFTHQQLAYPLVSGGVRGPYYPNTTIAAVVSLPIDLTGRALARTEVTAAEARAARADLAEARRAAT